MAQRLEEQLSEEPTNPESSSSAANDPVQTQARVRRKARKRDGPPQLQFLTATDPSQFKNEKAKRSVRSHAMADYRYKAAEQQRRKSKGTGVAFASEQSTIPVADRVTPVMSLEGSYKMAECNLMTQMMGANQEGQRYYSSTLEAWWDLNREEDPEAAWDASGGSGRGLSQFNRHAVVPLNAAAERVIEFEESDEHEENQIRFLISRLVNTHRIGEGVDPFFAIPQFRSPGINTLWLVRKCNRAFVSPATSLKWLPAMLSHPHILLSSVILASTYLDMHAGCSGDSKRTALVKGEVIGFVNERLQNSVTRFQDTTLMVMIHLLAGEMWSCNERILRIHQSGIARLIVQRGGLGNLGGNGLLAEVSAATCYHCDIFCEATPLSIFLNWEPSGYAPFKDSTAIPESPLFCPRSDFMTITKDSGCSAFTYSLLCDMRDLTDMFLAHNAKLNTIFEVDAAADEFINTASSIPDYESKVGEIRARLAALPSAYAPGLPTSGDWLYEACRITAIIYTAAIIMRVPFSVAAEPSRNPILTDTASLTNSPVGGHLLTTRLTEALYEVLDKTPTKNVWNDMAGVLYWISLVGAAAARTPASINMSRPPRTREESYATWIRRCLIMFCTRTWLVLLFPHPIPIIMAQKKMLRVQEIINADSSRKLTS